MPEARKRGHYARPLLGLVGHRGTGKSTIGEMMARHCEYFPYAFADAVKLDVARHLAEYTNTSETIVRYLEEHKRDGIEENPHWTRHIVRAWGEAKKGLYGEDYWVSRVKKYLGRNSVFTDVRFPAEAQAIRDRGGLLWRVTRPGCGPDLHVSDSYIDAFTVSNTIDNSGDLECLWESVRACLGELDERWLK